jgi:hypothetical protein
MKQVEDNWNAYMEAIAEPYNEFLKRANEIENKALSIDAGRAETVLSWAADNIFYDGARLGDVVPIDGAIE